MVRVERRENTLYKEEICYPVPHQHDSYNCGVYIVEIERRISMGNCLRLNDIEMNWMNDILIKSDDMTDVCLYCGQKL